MTIAPFLLISWCPLWICYGEGCVHFAVPSGTRSVLFFLGAWMSTFIFGMWLYDFWVFDTDNFTLRHLLPDYPWPWIKDLSAKTTKYIPKCWEKSAKRRSNLISIRVIKNSSFDHHFLCTDIYMVQTFLNILWWRLFILRLERLMVCSEHYCKTWNISTFSMLV